MGSPFPSESNDYEGLLFVITGDTRTGPWGDEVLALEQKIGDRVLTLDPTPATATEAVAPVQSRLKSDDSIIGVVLLGDYASLPARPIALATEEEREESKDKRMGDDGDLWQVWTDDPYGAREENGMAEVPVSRILIAPRDAELISEGPGPLASDSHVFGILATEFEEVEDIFNELLASQDPVMQSPPTSQTGPPSGGGNWTGPTLQEGALASGRLYLVLHGSDGPGMKLRGSYVKDRLWTPVAVDRDVVAGDWETGGVVFSAACWGGLTVDITARAYDEGEIPELRDIDDAMPLAFLSRGARAYIGFTGTHYMPNNIPKDGLMGTPLHRLFWTNVVVHRWPPAKALFEAKKTFINAIAEGSPDLFTRAMTQKTYWSAACFGLGWTLPGGSDGATGQYHPYRLDPRRRSLGRARTYSRPA